MMLAGLLIAPVVTAVPLAFYGHRRFAPAINIAGSAAALLFSVGLAWQVFEQGSVQTEGGSFFVDAFNVFLAVLTAFVSMTTAAFSRPYMAHEFKQGRGGPRRMRLYHALFPLFLF